MKNIIFTHSIANILNLVPQEYKKLVDEELVHRYAQRNEQVAFACLFERYGHLVYGICLKYLKTPDGAKDAMQQIFIKLLEDLKRFEIEHFKPWLYKVAKNHCFMILRKNDPVADVEVPEHDNMEFEDELHQAIERENLLNELEIAVRNLNRDQRLCIECFYLQKMSYAEVARQTGFDLNRVKSAIQNGKRNLKNKLEALIKERA